MRHKNIYVLVLMLLLSGSLMAQVRIGGSVYGGCELGQVGANATVTINGGTIEGSAYGGGKGVATDEQTGLVKGNTTVTMTNGSVSRSIYGGGEMGSVGTFTATWGAGENTLHVAGEPKTCQAGTGIAKVVLSGNSQVGVDTIAIMPPPNPEQDDYGYIFCGSRGIADSIRYPKANLLAIVDSTYLEIGGNALVTASAYGGCENGQVLRNTYVKITGDCQIGVGHYRVGSTHHFDPKYTDAQWSGVNPADFHEVSHWPFRSPYNIYDAYANEDGYYDNGNTVSARGGSHQPSNGHTFYGNVFGGGSGYYAIEPDPSGTPAVPYHTWRRSAGRVNGNTKVDFQSGHILNNLYGGNEMTDVIGSCTVNMRGGTLGVPRTLDSILAHPVSCYLFGAGKGDPRTFFNKMTNVGSVTVNVTGGRIFGSVFGGGEDGHVMGDVVVNIDLPANDTLGTTGTSYVDGNVFGGGRGFDGIAQTAGNVGGNIIVNISSGRLLGSVYGGGRLASVGTDLLFQDEANYGVMSTDPNRGHITVNITGGVIGNDVASDYNQAHSRGGNVYGGSMGRLTKLDGTMALPLWHKLGQAKSTTVTINGDSWVKGNVYGGSELGTVTEDITVNISGNVTVGRKAASTTFSHGNVYGGGVGRGELTAAEKLEVGNAATSDSIPTFAGLTGGTIQVNISGGAINNNVYGGGEMASVGTIDEVIKHTDSATTYYLSWPYEYTYHGTSGDARVNITGGKIGYRTGSTTSGGDIYGSARGTVGDRYVTGRLATARVTHVDINLTAATDTIFGTVYGSGENGHVYDSAVVTLRNGLVLGSVFGGGKGTDKYTDQLKNPTTGALYDAQVYDIIAGKVFGNTKVNILGGRVAKNVYGGGNLASVGIGNYKKYGEGPNVSSADSLLAENSGHCYVNILGGIIGPDSILVGTTYNGSYAIPDGHVYGAGKGIVFPAAAKVGYAYDRNYYVAYVNKTFVIIGDSTQRSCDYTTVLTPHVTGNVFGGGENGHVRFDTYVQTNRGIVGVRPLGTGVTSDMGHWAHRGNVWGAGRGEDTNPDGSYCQSAGSVTRNTTIDIFGARIYRNVQAGGAMASVGPIKGRTGDSSTCVINVRLPLNTDTIGGPGHQGSNNAFGGYLGGGSRGIASPNGTDNSALATCHNSQINFYRGRLKNTPYGGGENGQMLGNTEINVYGGYIRSAIYGGGKGMWKEPQETINGIVYNYDNDTLSGYVAGNTTVNLLGGEVPFTYGGCRRANVGGNATINIGKDNGDGTYSGEASFIVGKDKVYGGNQYAGSPRGNIYVNVYKTAHTTTDAASYTEDDGVNGAPTYAINYVYGGSYNSPYLPQDSGHYAQVHVYGCENTIDSVYGGCASADAGAKLGIGANTKLIIDGGRFGAVFGGGDGTFDRYLGDAVEANIYGAAITEIHGGKIGSLYGGSNFRGQADTIRITVDNNGPCGGIVEGDEFFGGSNVANLGPTELSTTLGCGVKFNAAYGGSNQADIVGNVSLTIKGGEFEEVYAGSKGAIVAPSASDGMKDTVCADIDGNTHLTIQGGKIGSAFGGSNINGNITGTITVDVDIDPAYACADGLDLDYVYGGSNLATYIPTDPTIISPLVNLINGTVDVNVFGAGKGLTDDTLAGLVVANPKVVMAPVAPKTFRVKNNIYGGGEMASVGRIHYATSAEASSYNSAHPNAGMAEGDVYSIAANTGNIWVDIQGGTVGPDIVSSIDIDGHGDVFGGGLGVAGTGIERNMAYANNTTVTVSDGAFIKGSVFGGGENGHIKGNTDVTVSGGTVGVRIPYSVRNFNPEGPTGPTNRVYSGNVYGGGRGVDHYGSTHLSLTAGRVYGNTSVTISDSAHIRHAVYGGGSLASVGTFTRTANAARYSGYEHTFEPGTGLATVTVSGGIIGPSWDDLAYDRNGNHLIVAGDTITNYSTLMGHTAYVKDTLAQNYACLGENEGMVYGSGRGENLDPYDDGSDNTIYAELAFTNNTVVTISDSADVRGSVFGGGENGHVKANTQVNIAGGKIGGMRLHHNGFTIPETSIAIVDNNAADDELAVGATGTGKRIFRGNVYGGGRGVDHTTGNITISEHVFSGSAGRVYGNTEVNITGGKVLHNVFGGGSIASVGTYIHPGNNFFSDPESIVTGTGKTTVNISGGQIGVMGENEGGVYGGGRGIAAASNSQATHLAYVDQTSVHISATASTFADVRGSVFGGGMNGHVLHDTYVKISGGIIGGKTADDYGTWDTINFPLSARPANPDTIIDLGGGKVYNYYAGIHASDTLTDHYGRVPNGIVVFLGNVYGGGRGVDTYTDALSQPHLSATAGRVYGNTHVLVTGGLIYHNLYGGGSIASVGKYDLSGATPVWQAGGLATVDVRGGRIGTSGRNNGRVFGSGRGMAGTNYAQTAYVNITNVTIGKSDTTVGVKPYIRGAVFGSGENGHVLDSTLVVVNRGEIGNGKRTDQLWINKYIGNVYGGGRGVDLTSGHLPSQTAGWVGNSTHVVINGGHIHNSVYGGGSLGSVGPDGSVGYKNVDVSNKAGRAWVDINGGLIGVYKTMVINEGTADEAIVPDTLHSQYGSVYGASRGRPGIGIVNGNDWSQFAFVTNTVVRVNYSNSALPDVSAEAATGTQHIVGNVYGGGNNGHVNNSTLVTVTRGRIGSDGNQDYGCLDGNVYGGGSGEEKYSYYHRNAAGKYCNASGNAVNFNGVIIPKVTPTSSLELDTLQYLQGSTINPPQLNYQALGIVVTDSNSRTAGQVYGNADVLLNGADAHVVGNVFGGGALSLLGTDGNAATGTATVELTNGTVDGSLYGAGKGRGEEHFKTFCDVRVTDVDISGGQVKGDVYGGGQNGHVLEGTDVNITGGTIGDATVAYSALAGNVFGGGQGSGRTYDHDNNASTPNEFRIYKHAGRVGGNTTVTITDGSTLIGSVFGGGRLALTGVNADGEYDPTATVADHGNTTVTVTGGSIGIDNAVKLLQCDWSVGDIMGSGKGDIENYEDAWAGRVTTATVTVTGNPVVRGSVFGGGEMASVGWWNTTNGIFYTGTGTTSVTIGTADGSDNPTIGLAEEFGYTQADNPGDWTMYNSEGKIVHTCTGNVFGGSQGDVDVSKPHWVSMAHSGAATVTIHRGTIRSKVFGGSEQGMVKGNTLVTINNGTIGTNVTTGSGASTPYVVGGVYAAGYGSDDPVDEASTYPELDDNGDPTGNNLPVPDNDSVYSRQDVHLTATPLILSGRTFGDAQVDILGGHILGSVYGGGENASVGYELSSSVGRTYVNIGNSSQVGHPAVGTTIDGDVFGANNLRGTPYGNTNVNIYHTAHSGTNGYPNTETLKTLAEPTTELTGLDLRAQYVNNSSMPQTFALHAVYGGGNKAAHSPHADDGVANVHIWYCDENTINEVYGGGNAADTKNNHLIIDGGRIHRVFGGGNGEVTAANVNGTAHTEIKGGLIDSVWGGSNQLGYILNTNLEVTLADPNCPEVIDVTTAGGNEAPSGGGTVTVSCGAYQENFYAGGSFSDVGTPDNPTTIILNVEGGRITNLYAGCQGDRASYGEGHSDRPANVYGDIILNFHGGNVTNLFGGSHRNGNITGTITVNVDIDPDYTCDDGLKLDYVYGAGQDAAYTPFDPFRASPAVNIMNNRYHISGNTGTMADSGWVRINDVFGGGLGATALSTSYPRVIVGGFGPKLDSTNTGTEQDPVWNVTTRYTRGARIFGNVYGGGNAAPVIGNTAVIVRDAVIGSDNASGQTYASGVVFGGGYGTTATITGETYVGIFGKSDIKNNVYGGGNAGIVTGSTEIQIGYQPQIPPVDIIGFLDATDNDALKIRFQSPIPGVKYRYTIDGTTPTVTSGNVYSAPFPFGWSDTIQVIAYLWDETHGKLDSSMVPSVISFDKAPAPVITIKQGTTKDTVILDGTIGARIRYTTDGSVPTHTNGTEYGVIGEDPEETPFVIDHGGTQVVKAFVEMRGCYNSNVTAFTADKPVITFNETTNKFEITAAQAGDRIIYTTDLSTPTSAMSGTPTAPVTENGTKETYNGTPIEVPVSASEDTTVKAIVERTGYLPSLIEAKVYQAP